jgi:tRNA A-37 threonylcarbamoyl transferase component Bud32
MRALKAEDMGGGSKRLRITKREIPDDFTLLREKGWEGIVRRGYEDLLLIAEEEDRWFERAIRVFNVNPNRVFEVYFPIGDRLLTVVVKFFGWRKPFHRWVSPFMESKALHSLKTALRLLSLGLQTPLPLAAFEFRERRFVSKNLYITESLGETRTLRWILRKGEDPLLSILFLEDAGKLIRKMHDGGLFHRDLTLANFLIPEGDKRLYLIDLNRAILKERSLRLIERVEDISKMDLQDEEFSPFLRGYFSPAPVKPQFEKLVLIRARLRRRTRSIRKRIFSLDFPSFSREQRSVSES